jgi:hypothetical protein
MMNWAHVWSISTNVTTTSQRLLTSSSKIFQGRFSQLKAEAINYNGLISIYALAQATIPMI